MAGLWISGKGKITFYVNDLEDPQPIITEEKAEESKPFENRSSRGIFFLPQKPYMVLGTLRQQLLYPTWAENPTSDGAEQTGEHLKVKLYSPLTPLPTEVGKVANFLGRGREEKERERERESINY